MIETSRPQPAGPSLHVLSITTCRMKQGEKMIENLRAHNRPITPHALKLARWMDSLEAEGMAGEAPMLKPGGPR